MKVNDNSGMSEKELKDCIHVVQMTKMLILKEIDKLIEKGGANAHIKKINALMDDVVQCKQDIKSFEKELKSRGEDNE